MVCFDPSHTQFCFTKPFKHGGDRRGCASPKRPEHMTMGSGSLSITPPAPFIFSTLLQPPPLAHTTTHPPELSLESVFWPVLDFHSLKPHMPKQAVSARRTRDSRSQNCCCSGSCITARPRCALPRQLFIIMAFILYTKQVRWWHPECRSL